MSFIFEWLYNSFSSVLQFLGNAAGPPPPGARPGLRRGLAVALAGACCQHHVNASG